MEPREKRSVHVATYLSEDQAGLVQKMADEAGLTVSTFIRVALLRVAKEPWLETETRGERVYGVALDGSISPVRGDAA